MIYIQHVYFLPQFHYLNQNIRVCETLNTLSFQWVIPYKANDENNNVGDNFGYFNTSKSLVTVLSHHCQVKFTILNLMTKMGSSHSNIVQV